MPNQPLTKERLLKILSNEIDHCRAERRRLGKNWERPEDASWEVHQNEGYLSGLQYAESQVKRLGN